LSKIVLLVDSIRFRIISHLSKFALQRLDDQANAALRELTTTYYASCAPTNDYIIKEGQGQIDWCFSERLKCKSAQMSPTQFLVWSFDELIHDFERLDSDSLHIHLPIFLRVRILDIHTILGKKFIKCTCKKWKRRGHPCECMFCVFDNGKLSPNEMLDLGMIDVRFWKMYSAFYGDNSLIGKSLMEAQEECFKHENNGIELKHDTCALVTGDLNQSFARPKLGRNTTHDDLLQMKYVLKQEAATLQEFLDHKNGYETDEEMNDNNDRQVSGTELETKCSLSQIAETYKEQLDAAVQKRTNYTVDQKYNFVGDLTKMIKHVADDNAADAVIMDEFQKGVSGIYEETLRKMRANKQATELKCQLSKPKGLKTAENTRKCPIMKAYGTPRHPREAKAKRAKSAGGF
jgi:hypothetical protein